MACKERLGEKVFALGGKATLNRKSIEKLVGEGIGR